MCCFTLITHETHINILFLVQNVQQVLPPENNYTYCFCSASWIIQKVGLSIISLRKNQFKLQCVYSLILSICCTFLL